PTLGKMSTGIRRIAIQESNATVKTMTRTVTGRRNAARTSHIPLPRPLEKLVEVPFAHRESEHGPPDTEPGQGVVDFGLREQSLSVSHFHDGGEAGPVPRRCLPVHGAGCLQLNGSVRGSAL